MIRPRYAGNWMSSLLNKGLEQAGSPNRLNNPWGQAALSAVPELGVRLVMGQNPVSAVLDTAVSTAAQGYGKGLAQDMLPDTVNANKPVMGNLTAQQLASAGGQLGGMLGSTMFNAIADPFFRSKPEPMAPTAMQMGQETIPLALPPNAVTEEDIARERDYMLRKAAFNAYYAQQLQNYPYGGIVQ